MRINAILEGKYGHRRRSHSPYPIDILLRTILSQNTNDNNRDKAYRSLRRRFRSVGDIADANTAEIRECIKVAGLYVSKARALKDAARLYIREPGLFRVNAKNYGKTLERVLQIKGVGHKTAAIFLNFGYGIPLFPVDTHIYRVLRRLGIVPKKMSREKVYFTMTELVPDELIYSLHLNLIRFGREICTARNPGCRECFLRRHCLYIKKRSRNKTGD